MNRKTNKQIREEKLKQTIQRKNNIFYKSITNLQFYSNFIINPFLEHEQDCPIIYLFLANLYQPEWDDINSVYFDS